MAVLGPPILGKILSWGAIGSFESDLVLAKGLAATFVLNQQADTFDVTRFVSAAGGSKMKRNVPGLSSWGGTIKIQMGSPGIGNNGSVTFASGYAANINQYSLVLAANSHEVTAYGATDKAFVPGLVGYSGTFSGFLDGTTALSKVPNAPAAASFALTATKTIGGNIIANQLGINVDPSQPASISYSFVGDDQPTVTGASTTAFFAVDAGAGVYTITTPTVATLTMQATTGRTYAGSAFWTSIAIDSSATGLITAVISFQGTGALTVA